MRSKLLFFLNKWFSLKLKKGSCIALSGLLPRATSFFKHAYQVQLKHKKQYQLELVFRPYKRMILYHDFQKLKKILWHILLDSCQIKDAKQYQRKVNIELLAIKVDHLIILKKENRPIAYISGTFVKKNIFYINCAVVAQAYQHTSIGSILTAALCHVVLEDCQRMGLFSPYFVCRTQNRAVASALLRSMEHGKISTETTDCWPITKKIKAVAEFLNCPFDEQQGISHNVYHAVLPQGYSIREPRIHKAFQKVGPLDACYIIGKINSRLVASVIERYVGLSGHRSESSTSWSKIA